MKLSVEGYKSIATKRELDFDGLTVLAGANSSGKSSFMQPFLILKQTIENHYDTGALVLDGENIKLTDTSQVISKVPGYEQSAFSVCHADETGVCKVTYKQQPTGLVVGSVNLRNNKTGKDFTLEVGMASEDIKHLAWDESFNPSGEINGEKGRVIEWFILRDKCFLSAEFSIALADISAAIGKIKMNPTQALEDMITSLIHVPGLRGNPERTYKMTVSEKVYPGSFEKYVASIIARWSQLNKDKFDTLKTQLNELGLAKSIKASVVNGTNVELEVSRSNASQSDCVNIADVGFGVSQTIPVLVALICANKDQLVYIEQPELHLHPKAQFKLAAIIAKAAVRGVKVVIETHSSILLRGIQIAIVNKTIDHNLVSLNWFTQDDESGETSVNTAELDEYGAFGEWPEDFDDIGLTVEQMYLDAVEAAISGE